MMQRRSIFLSLLLVTLLSAFTFTSALAQNGNGNTVAVESKASLRCVSGTLNVTAEIAQDISALELVLTYSGDATVNSVSLDASLAALGMQGDVSVPGTIRLYALDNSGGASCLPAGSYTIAQINYTTADVCEGSFSVDGGTFVCENGAEGSTQFVDCPSDPLVDPAIVAATVTGGSISIGNAGPSVSCPDNQTMHWGDVLVVNALGSDPDEANGCESLNYKLGSESPSWASISANGAVTLAPGGGDVCVSTVTVIVTDKCGAEVECSFDVCVQNTPPVAICDGAITNICWGETASGQVSSSDADNGPLSASYSVVSFSGPGTASVDAATGEWSWDSPEDPSAIGTFELCIKVTDGAEICDPCSPSNSDICCVSINVVPNYRVTIETKDPVIQGGPADLSVFLDGSYENYPMAGYDFLIGYDASAMSITGADAGGMLNGNNWEYFTYRFGVNGNCGSGCPSGKFRFVALADINDGSVTATGYTNVSGGSDELAVLHFQISGDRSLQCNFASVYWCWYDCGDNAISSVSGDSLFLAKNVYTNTGSFGDGGASAMPHTDTDFPSVTGTMAYCWDGGGVAKPSPTCGIDFKNGGFKIACSDSIDARGDINLNGVDNEIADAVVFTNYFVSGVSAFTVNVDGQTQASDVNADGIVLTVADLVYLIRIIVGDALPIPKLAHGANTALITTQGPLVSTNLEMGSALFVFAGAANVELLQSGLTVKTGMREGNTYAIVTPDLNALNSGVSITADGAILSSDAVLISVEAASYDGSIMSTVTEVLPENFTLNQNYPNPFNPSTKLRFGLPVASEYTIAIYNVSGQIVETLTGNSEAGFVELDWNANGLASGIYFYKLSAGNFVATKKMLLLK